MDVVPLASHESRPIATMTRPGSRAWRQFVANHPDPLWWRARHLVANQYVQHFHADLSPAFPRFLGLLDARQTPLAAIGARFLDESVAFCQRYLDRPIEQLLGGQSDPFDSRGPIVGRIVELGNLAVIGPRLLAPMFEFCARWLVEQRVPWVVFCLTRELRALLAHAGAELLDLGPARPEAVGEMITRWGSYYEHEPRVMAARVGQTLFDRPSALRRWSQM